MKISWYIPQYWAAIRNTRQKNKIMLLNELLNQDHKKPLKIIPGFRKTIIVENGVVSHTLLNHGVPDEDILTIHHQVAYRSYPEDHVCIPGCVGYTAYKLAEKHGWGDHESSAVELNGNTTLMEALLPKKMEEDMANEILNNYFILDKNTRMWLCKDMILFTKADDDDNSESTHSPIHSDSYVPVGF